jgi:hypothetical protein
MGFIPALVSKGGNKYRQSGGGQRGWEFPDLLELRQRWEIHYGGAWEWHNPEITKWQEAPSFLKKTA